MGQVSPLSQDFIQFVAKDDNNLYESREAQQTYIRALPGLQYFSPIILRIIAGSRHTRSHRMKSPAFVSHHCQLLPHLSRLF